MGDEDEHDIEDMSRYDKSGVALAWCGLADIILVLLPRRLWLIPAISAMVYWLTHKIHLSSSVSWWFPLWRPLISRFLVLISYITQEHEVKSFLSISSCHQYELTPSTAYTKYCIHQVMYHPMVDSVSLPASLSSLSGPCSTQISTFPHLQVNQYIKSQLPLLLPPNLQPPDCPPPNTPPTVIDHDLQLHHQICSIMACKCIT